MKIEQKTFLNEKTLVVSKGNKIFGVLLALAGLLIPLVLYFLIGMIIAGAGYDIIDFFEEVPALGIVAILISIISFVLALGMLSSHITVTDRRVYGKGMFGKRIDLPLNVISSVGTSSWFSSIIVASSSGALRFYWVENHNELHQVITKLLLEKQEKAEEGFRTTSANSAAELEKYKSLYDSGVITQEEFEAKKKQILGL